MEEIDITEELNDKKKVRALRKTMEKLRSRGWKSGLKGGC